MARTLPPADDSAYRGQRLPRTAPTENSAIVAFDERSARPPSPLLDRPGAVVHTGQQRGRHPGQSSPIDQCHEPTRRHPPHDDADQSSTHAPRLVSPTRHALTRALLERIHVDRSRAGRTPALGVSRPHRTNDQGPARFLRAVDGRVVGALSGDRAPASRGCEAHRPLTIRRTRRTRPAPRGCSERQHRVRRRRVGRRRPAWRSCPR